QQLTTACYTPVYVDGRFVGAWGNTLDISSYLMRAVNDAPAGASSLIVAADGDLIAYPGIRDPARVTAEAVARYERELNLDPLIALIRAQNDDHGVVTSPDGRQLVAYGRIGGPDWYFLISMPKADIAREAGVAAFKILGVGAIALLIQLALVMYLIRGLVTRPLSQLLQRAVTNIERTDDLPFAELDDRQDEIGVLARALTAKRRGYEELLHSLESRVQHRTAELERANEAKSSFLANMSHELRTPLNGVVALSDLLKDRQTEPENREMASLIVSSGRLLEQVVNDILDMSKIEAGQLKLESAPFDLSTCLRRICDLHAAAAMAKGVSLSWRIDDGADAVYEGDAVRLTQILSNLLSNAVKFTEKGHVRLEATRAAGGLRLDVQDTGIGFDEETAQRLFRRFEQADASMTRRFGGTGLGLSICRSLSEMMGGRIDVTSTPGSGSTFTLWLPMNPVAAAQPAPDSAPTEPPAQVAARILLAEDHPTNQRVVALVLEPLGVDLVIVDDGAKALDHAIIGGFDLILMDVQMPEMDGLTATRLIRAHEAETGARRTPIVSLTANALGEHVVASLEAGADLHLAKPIRPDALIATVLDLIGHDECADEEVFAA
ncbi:MAG TPA: ATP-binding protein, partial [Caulobacteraceae bacterium]